MNATKTHCKHGHEFTEKNTRITRAGDRQCITCGLARSRAHRKSGKPPSRAVLSARFWSRVDKEADAGNGAGCWYWTGSDNGKYGAFSVGGRMVGAHRFAYKDMVGPITSECLDHLCRNTLCVNPDHLEQVSIAENTMRGDSYNRRKTHCNRGHLLSGTNVRIVCGGSKFPWRRCRACLSMLRKERV